MIEILWGLSNIACTLNKSVTISLIKHEIFQTVVSLMESQNLNVRGEAIHTVSNAITSAEAQELHNMLVQYPRLLNSYMKGLKLNNKLEVIMAILDGLSHMCNLDIEYDLRTDTFREAIVSNEYFNLVSELAES